MMHHAGLLLCLFVLEVHTASTNDASEGLPYTCEKQHAAANIHLENLINMTGIHVINGDCTINYVAIASNKATLTDCHTNSAITIVIEKSSNRDVIGGDGLKAYTLYCFDGSLTNGEFPDGFQVHRTANAYQPGNPVPSKEYELMEVTLKLYKNGIPIQTVVLGELITVLIKGPKGPLYLVKSCSAYGQEQNGQVQNLTLLEIRDNSDVFSMGKGNENGELMTTFLPAYNTTLQCDTVTCMTSTLHAFHFKNSAKVSLECIIVVCSSIEKGECNTHKSLVIPTASTTTSPIQTGGKKKRSSDSGLNVLRTAYVVVDTFNGDHFDETNGGHILAFPYVVAYVFTTILILDQSV